VNAGELASALTEADGRVLGIQTKLHRWAVQQPGRRFDDLFNLVCDPAVLLLAWWRVRGNRGARTAGVDGITAHAVRLANQEQALLEELRADLKARRFWPLPVRERMIPKTGGKLRRLGIPTVRDRVVQAALKLVLEPIFEADVHPCSYGFRPGRRAQDAIAEIHLLGSHSYEWVLEGDIEACFDTIDHVALLDRVRRRVGDKRVLALVKAFLKAGILTEDGAMRDTSTGTPQGGILSPLLANVALSVLDEDLAGGQAGRVERRKRRRHGLANYRLIRYADDGAPRTLKEVRCRRRYRRMRCCTRDEGAGRLGWWPFAVALQGEAANHREVRRSRAGVLSLRRWRAVSASGVDHEGERKRTTDEASKAYGWHRNRGRVVAPR
jgi:RNA-directed DNA polymerase